MQQREDSASCDETTPCPAWAQPTASTLPPTSRPRASGAVFDRIANLMNDTPIAEPTAWRRATDAYASLLSLMLVASIAVLIFPVSLQIFSRYTELIPSYIWTEELARFVFIWSIMLGAMLGIKEGTHFVVDVWPRLAPRPAALLDLVANLCVLVFAFVFVWFGIEF